MDKYSFLNAANTQFFADLYDQYVENPDSVEASWRAFFQGFDFARENYGEDFFEEEVVLAQSQSREVSTPVVASAQVSLPISDKVEKELRVLNLIKAYQQRAHLFAKISPITQRPSYEPALAIENFGFTQADLNTVFDAAKELQLQPSPLSLIIKKLEDTFTQSIGIEFDYIESFKVKEWIQNKLYATDFLKDFTKEEKVRILQKLAESTALENFFHNKYVGQKRFSLEGNEAVIPAIDALIELAANEKDVKEVVIGMAHRGRLNMLINILGKNLQDVFSEFDGKDYENPEFDGDVKYHLGLTSLRTTTKGKEVLLNLAPNPSHLETVASVLEGIARAKQDIHYADKPSQVLPIVIHGDAAVAGQGIVYEVMQMERLKGYTTHGTVHVVINNQIGFTTNPSDSRSTTYCTDIAKGFQAPVLHVNSDDTEAVVRAFLFALDYRMTFGTDVFIDVIGYRKYGHNEGDEPRFTQPSLYKLIGTHKNPTVIYTEKLVNQGVITPKEIEAYEENYRNHLDTELEASRLKDLTIINPFMQNEWQGFDHIASQQDMLLRVDTSFSREKLDQLAALITVLPEDKKFINKISKIIKERNNLYFEQQKVDWGLAEHLAFATLLSEGHDVRISGEDVGRGTFSHRHAVIKTEDTEEEIIPLSRIKELGGGTFRSFNSLLSEYGVLGFEYGYALTTPQTLTIWEAQFGDFANGAQIMIDQYISCGEDKWKNQSGLVMLLPHGYEGQGAEHSSARLERYLQLCASQNMFVTNCTTPANIYHLLRRQLKAPFRKPVIACSPKSLLRHPLVISSIEELTNGYFQEVIDDAQVNPQEVRTLVFCSGRFYYDLLAEREKLNRQDVALVRIEQLFPLPVEQLKEVIARYPNVTDYVWAQEDPKNMGAYAYMLMNFDLVKWRLAAMNAYAAPAPGSPARHKARHQEAINKVFSPNK
ncbi:2-oxoglutarate dehydrogenase E1 component [uncultured Capnocytophaga sp.]|jgi:oxoglutarate dehydrogenase (succinyl-transferring), E1 component|uniref:2-oxoglutarate dehydrogenase E1 component n=1 Tax=uncultured Capnocytophaga sp. TaxID=159273 RepID=UPI0028E38071|nr:2-oxoglutarate dehydrogenase E1 component [uncultured Capnocytophaga sp.]